MTLNEAFAKTADGKPLTSTNHPTPVHVAIEELGLRGITAFIHPAANTSTIIMAVVVAPSGGLITQPFDGRKHHEIGNSLLDTARRLYPERNWNTPVRSTRDIDPRTLVQTTIELPSAQRASTAVDHELELAYSRADTAQSVLWQQVLQLLDTLRSLRPGSALSDFNALRYNESDKFAHDVKLEITRMLRRQRWYKP